MATQINPPYIGTVYKDYSVLSLTGFALDLAVADTLNIIVTTNLPAGQVAQTKVKYYTIGKTDCRTSHSPLLTCGLTQDTST